jgi:hypothetical protein
MIGHEAILRLRTRGAAMIHLTNTLCATFLVYASVTRGGLGVALVLERVFGRA